MKPIEGYNKLRGGYYTPKKIAELIATWAIRTKNDEILEPSCGDGSFISAIADRLHEMGASDQSIKHNVTGVELDKVEASKASQYGPNVVQSDFLTYYQKCIDGEKEFDVIVGNPPFIRYQNFEEEYRKVACELMTKHGFQPNRLMNIWLPFLVLACKALKPDGRVGMVIPAELFQVDYAAEARLFLSNYFESLTLVTFKKLVFDDIQQEVILLLGERKSSKQGIRVVELDGLESLISAGQTCLEVAEVKKLDHSKDKWVKYYLSNEELNLLDRLNKSSKITNATDLYDVNVGLVSGENAFFVINQEIVDKFHLQESVVPIISRTDQIKGLELTEQDYENLVKAGKKVYFFEPADLPIDELPKSQRKYIQWGEAQEYNKNYKCRIRPRWYHVSYTWRAEAFLVRQANLYPKMVLNNKHALVTDTLHKVRFHEGVDGRTVVGAFLNTYTLALSETLGRSYGGGVLTFEPGEMRKMRIPMIAADKLDLDKMDALQREGKIDDILQYTDEILLHQGLGLTAHEVELLHNIWSKMKDRRLSRKNRKG